MTHDTTSRRRPSPAAILLVPVVLALVLASPSGHIAVLAAWTLTGLGLLALAAWRLRAAPPRELAIA